MLGNKKSPDFKSLEVGISLFIKGPFVIFFLCSKHTGVTVMEKKSHT